LRNTLTLLALILLLGAIPAASAPAKPERVAGESLAKLLERHFGKLYRAEELLADAAVNGKHADCTDLSGDDKKIRGELLSWLCTDPDATAQMHFRGIWIDDAEIVGDVDLSWARITFPLVAYNCRFSSDINLTDSHMTFLALMDGSAKNLDARSARFESSLLLRDGFKAEGGVDLVSAEIDGNLDCDGGQFIGSENMLALNANGVLVKRSVFLRNGFKAEGGVDLVSAEIDGNLECEGGQFIGTDKVPGLDASGIQVKGRVFLRDGFKAEGGVNLIGAKVDGNLECDSGTFIGNDKTLALNANDAEVKGDVFLRQNFIANGGVELVAAKIDKNLECDSGTFIGNDKTPALNANDAEVKGNVLFGGSFEADGGVNLLSAKIEKTLRCDGGLFIGDVNTLALNANFVEVNGGVFCRAPFIANGEVNLTGAKIGNNFECDGGKFISKNGGMALCADSVRIAGHVFLRANFMADGSVDFTAGDVAGIFEWIDVDAPEKAKLDLSRCRIGKLYNKNNWPTQGNLSIDGCVYEQIDQDAQPKAKVQLEWLSRQISDQPFQMSDPPPFRSQPYEQLAAVFRKMGLEEEARDVMVAKNEEHAKYVRGEPQWLWYGLFGHLIGYGYRPWRAFFISLGVIGFGFALFFVGYWTRLITPTSDEAYCAVGGRYKILESYPKFNSLVYSIETFVPLVKMGIGDHWMTNANRGWRLGLGPVGFTTGGLLRIYYWIHITAGWVLSALWVGALTGLVKT
jgi:hypothetical protein